MPPDYPSAPEPVPFTAGDQSNLNVLGILHFIYAVLIGLGALVLLAAVALGAGFLASVDTAYPGGRFTTGTIVVILLCLAAVVVVKACVVFYSGMSLRKARHHLFSQIVACICCLNFPLGTILGVFTLIVLSRPSVRALYAYRANGGV